MPLYNAGYILLCWIFFASDYSVLHTRSCAQREVPPVNEEVLSHMAGEDGILQLWAEPLLFTPWECLPASTSRP